MPEDHRSVEEIERELERQRLILHNNLSALQDRLSLSGIANEAMGSLRPSAPVLQQVLRSLDGSVRANPLAALVAGAGLVWLASGPFGRGKTDGGSQPSMPAATAAAVASVVAAMKPEEVRAVAGEIDRIYREGAARLRELDRKVRARVGGVVETARDKTQQAQDIAAEKARIVNEVAAAVKTLLEHGLDGLSEEAAAAVAAARERAYAVRRKASREAGVAYHEVAVLVDSHPLAMGVAALSAGALFAVALNALSAPRGNAAGSA